MNIFKIFRRSESVDLPATPKAPRIGKIPLPRVEDTEDSEKDFVLELKRGNDRDSDEVTESDRSLSPISPVFRKRKGSLTLPRSETPQSRCTSRSSSSSYPHTPAIVAPTPQWNVGATLREDGWKRCHSPADECESNAVPTSKHERTPPRTRASSTTPTSLFTPALELHNLHERTHPLHTGAAAQGSHTTPDDKRRRRSTGMSRPPTTAPTMAPISETTPSSQRGSVKPPVKGILKSTPKIVPLSSPIYLHWQLLPYDPARCKKKLFFDVALEIDFMRDVTTLPGLKLGTVVMDKLAANISLTEMRMQCRQLPHWDIIVSNPLGITCGDVYTAIYLNFNRRLTSKERAIYVTERRKERVQEAFEQRCRDTPELDEVVQRRGLLRVDLLEGKRIFMGLSRPPDSDEYWILDVGYPAPSA